MLNRVITKHEAGDFVKGGIYWSRKAWDLTTIPEEGGRLPTAEGADYYYHLPVLAVMLLGPFAGLAFVIFLPIVGAVVAVYVAPRALVAAIRRRRRGAARDTFRTAGTH